jgi:hypothetical protein
MSTNDKRIREFAYQIWESEGKPEAEAEALAPSKSPKAAGSKTAATKTPASKPNGKAAEPKTKAKPAATAKVIPPGEKANEKKPRAARKPPAV